MHKVNHHLVLTSNPLPGCGGQLHSLEYGTIPNTAGTRQINCQAVTKSNQFSFIQNAVSNRADADV
jgi:hypothetical protein